MNLCLLRNVIMNSIITVTTWYQAALIASIEQIECPQFVLCGIKRMLIQVYLCFLVLLVVFGCMSSWRSCTFITAHKWFLSDSLFFSYLEGFWVYDMHGQHIWMLKGSKLPDCLLPPTLITWDHYTNGRSRHYHAVLSTLTNN